MLSSSCPRTLHFFLFFIIVNLTSDHSFYDIPSLSSNGQPSLLAFLTTFTSMPSFLATTNQFTNDSPFDIRVETLHIFSWTSSLSFVSFVPFKISWNHANFGLNFPVFLPIFFAVFITWCCNVMRRRYAWGMKSQLSCKERKPFLFIYICYHT